MHMAAMVGYGDGWTGLGALMNSKGQSAPDAVGRRTAGPQGTQLFSAEELHLYADEAGLTAAGRASTREPVLEGVGAALAGKRFALRSGRQTIGRGNDNDIVIDDASVSSSHAWIINQHGRHVIMNTLSTNGTYVNDRRVHETALKHGDRVRLGQAEFVFLTREHGAADHRRRRLLAAATLLLLALAAVAWWLVGLRAA
jgi:hypothetical protein